MPAKTIYRPRAKDSYDFKCVASIKQEWITALESGKYKLGYGALHQDDMFCPLGVLADVVSKKFPKKVKVTKVGNRYLYDECGLVLPTSIVHIAGLERADGGFVDRYTNYHLPENVELSLATLWDHKLLRGVSDIVKLLKNNRIHMFVN